MKPVKGTEKQIKKQDKVKHLKERRHSLIVSEKYRIDTGKAGEMQGWETYYTQTLSPLEPFSPSCPGSPCTKRKKDYVWT